MRKYVGHMTSLDKRKACLEKMSSIASRKFMKAIHPLSLIIKAL